MPDLLKAPCIKCKGTHISIGDAGESSFNYFTAKCLDCGNKVFGDCDIFPKMETMVGAWNSQNDPDKLIAGYEKDIQRLQKEIDEYQQKIDELKFWYQ